MGDWVEADHAQRSQPCRVSDVYNSINLYTSAAKVRTNIVIDDDLLQAAMKATGAKTKREVVELGLASLVRLDRQARLREYRGKLDWCDDLERMRSDT